MSTQPLFDLETPWFNAKFPLKKCTIKDIATSKVTHEQIAEYFHESQEAMEQETSRLASLDSRRWAMEHFQQRGTAADRIASAALELSDPSQLTVKRINSAFGVLFDIAQHDSHHFEAALNALAAVWPRLLPPRPLRKFAAQYFATLPEDEHKRKFVLAHWLIEDTLKRSYTQFLALAEVCLKDRLTQRRESWLNTCGRLLPRVTEGRPTLIALIVDKLGDPNKTMAHKAYHQLLDMLCESSTYQSVLLTELEKLALDNSHTTTKGQAYCVQVLAQFVFNKDEQKLSLRVINVYLALLRKQLAAGAADYSSTTAIIVGMRRAFPYAGNNFSILEEHSDTLFALAATGPFLQRVHALSLIHQLYSKGWKALEHRYYRALYASLLVPSAQLPHSSQLAGYFTLLFKSLRADTIPERVVSFIHRMLQQCTFHNEAFVCSILLMVGEFSRINPMVAKLMRNPSSKLRQQQQQGDTNTITITNAEQYDPKQRDPRFTGCSEHQAFYWHLSLLATHAHPSVQRLAKSLLSGDVIAFDVHPLDDLTLIHFLDMVTEGKTTEKKKPGTEGKGVPVFHRNPHVPILPKASDAAFAKVHPSAVDPAALFLHRFAHQRLKFMHAATPKWNEEENALEENNNIIGKKSSSASLLPTNKDNNRELDKTRMALFGPKPTVGDAQIASSAAAAAAVSTTQNNQQKQQQQKNKKKSKQEQEQEQLEEELEFNWGTADEDIANQVGEDGEELGGVFGEGYFGGPKKLRDEDQEEEDFEEFGGGDEEEGGGLSFAGGMNQGGDDFDEELEKTQAMETDRRRQREKVWLDRATGQGPTSPFNNANKNKRQHQQQQPRQQNRSGSSGGSRNQRFSGGRRH